MKHNAFSLPGFLALLMAATPTAAQKVDEEAILAAICETGQIREGECLKAHNYPSGPSCNVRLDGEIIEGRFFGPERTFLLADYSSNCEPHASNFGGSLIFEKVSAKLIFKAFEVGLAVSNCITLAKTNGGDRLICNLLGMAQGYESQLIGEVVFASGEPDQLTTSFVELLAAENSWAARGAILVKCDKSEAYFGFTGLSAGPSPDTIVFDIYYADKPLIEKLCAQPGRNAELGDTPPLDDEAYLAEGDRLTGQFIFDLGKRTLTARNK